MDAYGYRLANNASTSSPDFLPSLIGVDQSQVAPTKRDPYFDRIEISDRTILSITKTRWVTYDSLPLTSRDPILAIRGRGVDYYIPKSELEEIAAAHSDEETFAMLVMLFGKVNRAEAA